MSTIDKLVSKVYSVLKHNSVFTEGNLEVLDYFITQCSYCEYGETQITVIKVNNKWLIVRDWSYCLTYSDQFDIDTYTSEIDLCSHP